MAPERTMQRIEMQSELKGLGWVQRSKSRKKEQSAPKSLHVELNEESKPEPVAIEVASRLQSPGDFQTDRDAGRVIERALADVVTVIVGRQYDPLTRGAGPVEYQVRCLRGPCRRFD